MLLGEGNPPVIPSHGVSNVGNVYLSRHHRDVEALTYWGQDQMGACCRRHFEVHLHQRKGLNFDWNFTEICSQDPVWQYASISSDNGLGRPGDKPLSEPMMIRLLTHICVTRPQRVKMIDLRSFIFPFNCYDFMFSTKLCRIYFKTGRLFVGANVKGNSSAQHYWPFMSGIRQFEIFYVSDPNYRIVRARFHMKLLQAISILPGLLWITHFQIKSAWFSFSQMHRSL